MRGLTLIPAGTRFDFMKRKLIFFSLSAFLVVGSVAMFVGHGLNYGIDFVGGILIEVRTPGPADIGSMRETLSDLNLGAVSLQEFGAPDEVLVRVQRQEGGDAAQQQAVRTVRAALGNKVEYRRIEVVGPQVSDELFWDGVYAVTAALFAILLYIWFRFEWQFGVCALAALIHDVLVTVGMFSVLGIEFNLTTVAAVLTIAGYSINDTVVIFDRVRENLRRYKTMGLYELLNLSVNETLSRTIMTSFTTLLALFALYGLGGEVLRGFSFALIFGIVIGTYSTIYVATPLLLHLQPRRGAAAAAADAAGEAAKGADQR